MKEKQRKISWQASIGQNNPRVSVSKLEATEYLLTKEYNNDILIRVKDPKMRGVLIPVSDLHYQIMLKEMLAKISPKHRNIQYFFYLYGDGELIAYFGIDPNTRKNKEAMAEAASNRIGTFLDDLDKTAEAVQQKVLSDITGDKKEVPPTE